MNRREFIGALGATAAVSGCRSARALSAKNEKWAMESVDILADCVGKNR